MKNIKKIYLKIFIFLMVKFSIYLNRHVFVMSRHVFAMRDFVDYINGTQKQKCTFMKVCTIPRGKRHKYNVIYVFTGSRQSFFTPVAKKLKIFIGGSLQSDSVPFFIVKIS